MTEKLIEPNDISRIGLTSIIESSCYSDRSSFIYRELNDYEYGQLPSSPVDELTGVPLILHPEGSSNDSHRFSPDKHHPWHPKNHPLVKSGTLGGEALRASRVQLASYDLHHLDYHRNFYGPELPDNDTSRFNLIVLTAAGYIPEQALMFSEYQKPYLKDITLEQRLKLWQTGRIRVDSPGIVRSFLKDYSLGQDLSDINERVIDEFLFTHDPIKRLELGYTLIGKAVLRATIPIKDTYKEAFKAELLPPYRARKAYKFVLTALSIGFQRKQLLKDLEQRLKLAAA